MPVSPSLLQSMQSGQPIATSPEARQFREDYGRAVRQVPRSILDYVTNTPANEMASDVGGLLGAMAQNLWENPRDTVLGIMSPRYGAMLSARDFRETSEAIRQAEAQGDTRTADNLRQMNLLNMLGAVPVVGGFSNMFRNARRGLLDETVDTSYRMAHQPRGPDVEDPIRLDNLTRSTTGEVAGYPDDFYTNRGQRIYARGPSFDGDEFGVANLESYRAITSARNNPEAKVTIYRAVPQGINDINSGDFVTLSPKYAELHSLSGYGRNGNEAGHVISQTVRVKDIFWDGNDVNEFGYFPQRSIPPASNAQRTQLGTSTIPTYSKANDMFTVEGKTLDYGAGRGLGAEQIGADTFEPFPMEGFNPTYNNSSSIPSNSYPRITSLNVLNVMPREARDEVVRDIGRILEPNGEAIITTRGRDVMSAQGVPQSEPMSIITSRDTYQKGFTQSELREYVQDTLGENFEVINAPQKIGAAGIVVRKLR